MSEIKKIKVAGVEYGIADGVNREELQNLKKETTDAKNDINSKALHYNTIHFMTDAKKVNFGGESVDGSNTMSVDIPAATTENAGVMSAEDKKKLANLATEGDRTDLDTYVLAGVYCFESKILTNTPITNTKIVSARLTVLAAYDGTEPVITQVLNLNNFGGGEGNVYIRAMQNNTWKPWGKLQTNIEVGAIGLGQEKSFDDLTDNGIYSGVNVYQVGTDSSGYPITSYETFVLVVINAYLTGGGVTQLKYSLLLDGTTSVMTRTYTDAWGEWEKVGEYELPAATIDTFGGVKLGTPLVSDDDYSPIGFVSGKNFILGVGLGNGLTRGEKAAITVHLPSLSGLECGANGLYLNIGTDYNCLDNIPNAVPVCLGTSKNSDKVLGYTGAIAMSNSPSIPVNPNQFKLGDYGLELITNDITWDASSNMNNYTTAGVYDIYGERTNASDNLPFNQAFSGASFAARLTVVASTLQPDNTEVCVTQFLQLSNRMGGEGNTYIRTYNENNNGLNGWSEWKKQQGMVESYINTDSVGITATGSTTTGLNGMTDNGMYSGIYTDDYTLASPTFVETFVLVVINDYAVSGQAGTPRRISQLKYATDTITGQCTVKKRVGTGDDSISWSDWEDIGIKYLNPNDFFGISYISNLGVGTYEFSGTLENDDTIDSIWRYVFDDLGIGYKMFNMKVVIDSDTSATATIMGYGKFDIVTFNPSTNSDVVSIK